MYCRVDGMKTFRHRSVRYGRDYQKDNAPLSTKRNLLLANRNLSTASTLQELLPNGKHARAN